MSEIQRRINECECELAALAPAEQAAVGSARLRADEVRRDLKWLREQLAIGDTIPFSSRGVAIEFAGGARRFAFGVIA